MRISHFAEILYYQNSATIAPLHNPYLPIDLNTFTSSAHLNGKGFFLRKSSIDLISAQKRISRFQYTENGPWSFTLTIPF